MPNKEMLNECWDWADKLMWSIVAMFTMGAIARALLDDEEFDLKKLAGEVILAVLCSISMYAMGLMQGMSQVQIVLFGSMGSLGGVRTVQWLIRLSLKSRNTV